MTEKSKKRAIPILIWGLPISVWVPDLDKTWDETLVTFLILGLRDFFLDAKRSVYVFLVQS